jgi:hypothetical protein
MVSSSLPQRSLYTFIQKNASKISINCLENSQAKITPPLQADHIQTAVKITAECNWFQQRDNFT